MATTALFVELIVIGIGAAAWLGLTVIGIFGYSWVTFGEFSSIAALAPLLGVVYVLGIIVDRVADQAFDPLAKRLVLRWFSDKDQYYADFNLVYIESPTRTLVEYTKSRIRICRAWVINCIASAVALNVFVWSQLPDSFPRGKVAVICSIGLLTVSVGAFRAWYQLSDDGYRRLAQQAQLLRKGTSERG
jgi:hypothetical protein